MRRAYLEIMKKILVGLDGAPAQVRILDEAARLAVKLDAELVLFRSVAIPSELPSRALSATPDQVAEILLGQAREDLQGLARRLDAKLVHGVRVELGTPWRAILDAAKAENADLVVIGSHGYGGLDRLLGTTAAKVVNHADRSVMVVRPH
jgi:nucleotide-binding universal stress UspA family protein